MAVQFTDCRSLQKDVLEQQNLIIVSNRGPFSIKDGPENGSGEYHLQRSGGGLVTAMLGLARQIPSTWVACATSEWERMWKEGIVSLSGEKSAADLEGLLPNIDLIIPASGGTLNSGSGNITQRTANSPTGVEELINLCFVTPEPDAYEGYYQVIANPLLWFLQHSLWDFSRAPTINRATWKAWEEGYVRVNWLFAEAVANHIQQNKRHSLVMFQDYHLYLAPRMVRRRLRRMRGALLTHFIHIPWPGPEDWGMLPDRMREALLYGLCAVDLVGFQTKEDALNFIRTCESLLPGARVNYRTGRVILQNHITHVRDFPISIDVDALRESAASEEVAQFREQLADQARNCQMILRIDRTEPSKNIVRGFQAYEELLENYPEHRGKVVFVALLVPSRLDVEEYAEYLNTIMAAAGRINARFGSSEWEPVRLLVGESYPRALAAMQLYDVLLVNPVADGMNLVAKEGPTVNQKNGVVVLSERAGAHQQLGEFALVISPCDISSTADALHRALTMPADERQRLAEALGRKVREEDIHLWLCWQLEVIQELIRSER